ncbi:MAG: TetR/AcrR family transcriptional regulator, partial [Treponema socranskii subsp. buccale]
MAKKRIDRDKIIQAFLTCAFEKSAGAVSLADIASLLGVNKASLYNHFSSRDAIYEAAIDFCAEYMSGVRFIPESADSLVLLSFSDALAKIVKQYFRSYEIEPLFQMYAFI